MAPMATWLGGGDAMPAGAKAVLKIMEGVNWHEISQTLSALTAGMPSVSGPFFRHWCLFQKHAGTIHKLETTLRALPGRESQSWLRQRHLSTVDSNGS